VRGDLIYNLKEAEMSASLKWANRFRLDLAFEIAQLESGVRRVTQSTPSGSVDITDQVLTVLKDRFEQLEEIVFAPGDKQQAD
jgi:hypothetical protein